MNDFERMCLSGEYLPLGCAKPTHPPLYPNGSLVWAKSHFGEKQKLYRVLGHFPCSTIQYQGDWSLNARCVTDGEWTCGWEGYFEPANESWNRASFDDLGDPIKYTRWERLVMWFRELRKSRKG